MRKALFITSVLTLCLKTGLETGQEKRIFFLGAQHGDKNYLQACNGVFLC
jgi:hypothetical protein